MENPTQSGARALHIYGPHPLKVQGLLLDVKVLETIDLKSFFLGAVGTVPIFSTRTKLHSDEKKEVEFTTCLQRKLLLPESLFHFQSVPGPSCLGVLAGLPSTTIRDLQPRHPLHRCEPPKLGAEDKST